jgi:hypothetical protein
MDELAARDPDALGFAVECCDALRSERVDDLAQQELNERVALV